MRKIYVNVTTAFASDCTTLFLVTYNSKTQNNAISGAVILVTDAYNPADWAGYTIRHADHIFPHHPAIAVTDADPTSLGIRKYEFFVNKKWTFLGPSTSEPLVSEGFPLFKYNSNSDPFPANAGHLWITVDFEFEG